MASKTTIVLVVLAVLVTWLLISSINQINVPKTTSGGGSNPTGGTNGGNGAGSPGNLGGFSLPGFNFPFSFKFPDLSNFFKFGFPKFSTSLKVGAINLSWLDFKFPDLLNLGHFGNGGIRIKGLSFPSGVSNAAGSVTDLIHIPTFVFYILIAVLSVIILFGAYTAVRNRTEQSKDGEEHAGQEILMVGQETSGSAINSYSYRIAPYPGWDQTDHFIKPLSGSNYPLLGGTGEQFSFSVPQGSVFHADQALSSNSPENIYLVLSEGCNRISAKYKGVEDSLNVRGVKYSEEIIKLARANMANGRPSNLTMREIASDPDFSKDLVSPEVMKRIISEFERVKYGKIIPSADAFRQYVTDIGKAIRSPVVIICDEEESIG